jgi:hypothetical protein
VSISRQRTGKAGNVPIEPSLRSTLPGAYYTSPVMFEIEQQQIFARSWMCIGRADAVARPGQARHGERGDHLAVVAGHRHDDGAQPGSSSSISVAKQCLPERAAGDLADQRRRDPDPAARGVALDESLALQGHQQPGGGALMQAGAPRQLADRQRFSGPDHLGEQAAGSLDRLHTS